MIRLSRNATAGVPDTNQALSGCTGTQIEQTERAGWIRQMDLLDAQRNKCNARRLASPLSLDEAVKDILKVGSMLKPPKKRRKAKRAKKS